MGYNGQSNSNTSIQPLKADIPTITAGGGNTTATQSNRLNTLSIPPVPIDDRLRTRFKLSPHRDFRPLFDLARSMVLLGL